MRLPGYRASLVDVRGTLESFFWNLLKIIQMYPRANLSCQIVWDTSGGRTCRACAAISPLTDGFIRASLLVVPDWFPC